MIDNAFLQCLNDLVGDIDEVKQILSMTSLEVLSSEPTNELTSVEEKIRNLQEEMMELHAKRTSGQIIPDAYAKLGSKLADKIDALKKRKEELEKSIFHNEEIKERMDAINEVLTNYKPTEIFGPNLFRSLVDEITINDRNRITFKFKIGLSRTIIIMPLLVKCVVVAFILCIFVMSRYG